VYTLLWSKAFNKKMLSVLCSVAVPLDSLYLANLCAFGKLQFAHSDAVSRESLDFTSNVAIEEPEALAGFAPSYS